METLKQVCPEIPKMYQAENDISQERRAELSLLLSRRQWLWFVEAHSQANK
ncbi:MAG TPA: hypothetical protein VL863_09720 [bacterium]|jgi:hypothetical protein|nr:hypothetical protein [bacterium]